MAIAKISKIRLIGLNEDRDRILNTLQKTKSVEIKNTSISFDGLKVNENKNLIDVLEKKERVETSLSILINYCEKRLEKGEISELKDTFSVSSQEFLGILEREDEISQVSNFIIEKNREIIDKTGEIKQREAIIEKFKPLLTVKDEFKWFKDRGNVISKFGILPQDKIEEAKEKINEIEGTEIYLFDSTNGLTPIFALSFKEGEKLSEVLKELGFIQFTFDKEFLDNFGELNAQRYIDKRIEEIDGLRKEIEKDEEEIVSRVEFGKDLKVLIDRYTFENEKAEESLKFLGTTNTFILEGFIPETQQEEIKKRIEGITENSYIEFLPLSEDDDPPTLMENGKIASNFEFVTNMYSVPKYDSFDPNLIMGIFFSLFLGVISADVIYGIILAVGGYLFGKIKCKNKPGTRRLAYIIAMGGVFAIPFGILFDSFFGYALIHKICEASLGAGNGYELFYEANLDGIKSFSSLAGISIPTMLLWSMLLGAIHLTVGYILKAVQNFRRNDIIGAITEGICWAVFMVGLCIFAVSMLESLDTSLVTPLQSIGLVALILGLSVGVIFAGRGVKGLFGKAKSSFGALYGVINILSDILSYARLYGLMLSGSQIAAIFTNTIAIDLLFKGGPIGVIGGILVIVLGNIFNLAIGVLGAYIHDSRLQYVEFFGKFYEGEGRLFKPLGSTFDYIFIND